MLFLHVYWLDTIKGLSSIEISKKTISCTDNKGNPHNIQDASGKIPADVQEVVLELEVPKDFKLSTNYRDVISHANGQVDNLLCFLGLSIVSFIALCVVAPKAIDSRILLFSSMVLSCNGATLFLHPRANAQEACYTALCNTVLPTICAVGMGILIGRDKSWSFNKEDLGAMFCVFAGGNLFETLRNPLYIGGYEL